MNKTKIGLATILIFVAILRVMANPDFPPCASSTEIDLHSCHTLKCCTNGCDVLCPGPPPGSPPPGSPEHTKCYEGCNALYD
jgi:hypothetical protein